MGIRTELFHGTCSLTGPKLDKSAFKKLAMFTLKQQVESKGVNSSRHGAYFYLYLHQFWTCTITLNIQHAHKPSVLCFMPDIKLSPCPLQQLHQLLATFDDSMNKLSPAAVCLTVSIRVAAALHTQHKTRNSGVSLIWLSRIHFPSALCQYF